MPGFSSNAFSTDSFSTDAYDFGDVANAPDQFFFETRFKADVSTQYESNIETIRGLSAPAQSVVVNGEQSINGAPFTSDSVGVESGDTLQLRQTSSATAAAQKAATATIGGVVGTFVTVTAAAFVPATSWRRRAFFVPRRRAA